MAFVTNQKVADYSIETYWVPDQSRWFARAERRDTELMYEGVDTPDYVQLLRNTCRSIRSDVEDWGGFEAHGRYKNAPVGRYALSYHGTNPEYALLLDTKTGAVWELEHANIAKVSYRQFSRISVDGLYTSIDEEIAKARMINQSGESEEQKKKSLDLDEQMWNDQRKREDDLNDQ